MSVADRYKFCCTEIILHCVSVSNQLQQWTNFCTNFSPKSGEVGDASPVDKSGGRRPPAFPPHYTLHRFRDVTSPCVYCHVAPCTAGALCVLHARSPRVSTGGARGRAAAVGRWRGGTMSPAQRAHLHRPLVADYVDRRPTCSRQLDHCQRPAAADTALPVTALSVCFSRHLI